MVFKIIRKIHLWLSIPFGLIITLICFSGAVLVFEPELTEMVNRYVLFVNDASGTAMPVDRIVELVESTLPDSVDVTGVTVFADKKRAYLVSLSKPRRVSVVVNQYTGEIRGRNERLPFFSAMFKLHRWLLDSSDYRSGEVKVGKLIVGVSTLSFVVALVTGVAIWLPLARKRFRKSLSIPLKKGGHSFWRGLHIAGGMYVVLFLLLMSLTGLTWSFHWYNTAFYSAFGIEKAEGGRSRSMNRPMEKDNKGDRKRSDRFIGWQRILDLSESSFPDAKQFTLTPGEVSVRCSEYGNVRASDRYRYDKTDDTLVAGKTYISSSGQDKLRGWIYSMHTGAFGGIVTRVLWFLSALLGASLPLTGYYLWFRQIFS